MVPGLCARAPAPSTQGMTVVLTLPFRHSEILSRTTRPHLIWSPPAYLLDSISFGSSDPLAFPVPSKDAKHSPAICPLHWLFPLPAALFPRVHRVHPTPASAQMFPPQRSLPQSPSLKLLPPPMPAASNPLNPFILLRFTSPCFTLSRRYVFIVSFPHHRVTS